MGLWFWGLSAVLALFLAFVWWGRKPLLHTVAVSELPEFFAVLLSRGDPDATMHVRVSGAPLASSLVFARLLHDGTPALRLVLRSDSPFEREVSDRLMASGFLLSEASPQESSASTFLDLGTDFAEATRVVSAALGSNHGSEPTIDVLFRRVGAGPMRKARVAGEDQREASHNA